MALYVRAVPIGDGWRGWSKVIRERVGATKSERPHDKDLMRFGKDGHPETRTTRDTNCKRRESRNVSV